MSGILLILVRRHLAVFGRAELGGHARPKYLSGEALLNTDCVFTFYLTILYNAKLFKCVAEKCDTDDALSLMDQPQTRRV